MKRKIQVISNFNGQIIGTGIPEISSDDGETAPEGCTLLAGAAERVDLVELTPNVAKLLPSEVFRRCSMQGTTLKVGSKQVARKKPHRKR